MHMVEGVNNGHGTSGAMAFNSFDIFELPTSRSAHAKDLD